MDYTYAGNGARVERSTATEYTYFSGNSDEAQGAGIGDGTLERSYYGNADVSGTDPSTGTWRSTLIACRNAVSA